MKFLRSTILSVSALGAALIALLGVVLLAPAGVAAPARAAAAATAVPSVSKLAPSSGTRDGGTSVVITGKNFAGATDVRFGNYAASSFTVDSATQITAVSPYNYANAASVDVQVVNSDGVYSQISAKDRFTYVQPAVPTVTKLLPSSGSRDGGTSVVITGTNFTGASDVRFGNYAASSFTVDSATQITAVSPYNYANAASVDVQVANVDGVYSATSTKDRFTYVQPAVPTVTKLLPSSGSRDGGTSVVITGTNFTGASDVRFGNYAASSFTVDSPTQITAVSPYNYANAASVDVQVANVDGVYSATSAKDRFTYNVPAAATVTKVAPSSGPREGGTTVVVTGTNFTGATDVRFGNYSATSFTVDSPTQITAVSPYNYAGAVAVDVQVVNSDGVLSATSTKDRFTYTVPAAATVTKVAPNNGPRSGGTTVVVTGTNFTGATDVRFGNYSATSFTVDSPTQITAVAPYDYTGAAVVDVQVANPDGVLSKTSTKDRFTYTDQG